MPSIAHEAPEPPGIGSSCRAAAPSIASVRKSMPLGLIPHADAPGGSILTPHGLASNGSIVLMEAMTTAPTLAWWQMTAAPTAQAPTPAPIIQDDEATAQHEEEVA
eukprot:CAMPEP_0195136900 /NCGR_PEP_ID=MMETSP0448-20130528/155044_1 /TAXON_ID=66468 /ORGANISM="Heterocapsa triquestra, Strain CCMP 448" /LENGTH=105 /DNA_ID=CAMNT_0040175107 /DNA_START=79 /DNA_END=392 /DNA_ORIENTATION=-